MLISANININKKQELSDFAVKGGSEVGALIVTLGLLAFLAVTDMTDSWCTLMQ